MDRSIVNESQDDFFERYQYIRLGGRVDTTAKFRFQLNNAWKAGRLDLVVFVQDRKTGLVYQSMVLPWVQSDSRTGSGAIGKAERHGCSGPRSTDQPARSKSQPVLIFGPGIG